ncbi:hypothetical protein F5X68DRAFT_168525 [Plectosphaerella plurivora]|uniref:LysM domain-containing protein n=1 Tax=Plectosphaerella plurivora TaxID=936078 RepID=A0A9P8VDV0_9PEZI|nr:hypothetical protein F5X68DRAFT_168525 [Plectosphaerella plurivora]
MVSNCNKFHYIKTTTTCQSLMEYYSLAWADLYSWNPAFEADCGNLWSGTYACVGVTGSTTKPTTTTAAGNGITTPTPIQEGMVKNCDKFHLVKTTTTCQSLMDYFGISWANLYKWNPAIGSSCQSLWANTHVCVGVVGGDSSPPPSTTVGNGISTPTPIQEGMVKNCNKFHLVKTTTTCQSLMDYYNIPLANLYKWNPAIGSSCQSLWANTNVCVGVVGGSPAPTTTAGNGVATPTPIQEGMVKNCNKFHLVKTTTTCQSIMDYYNIPWANLYKWNPAIGSSCSSLWANTYACVGVIGGSPPPATTVGNGIATPTPIQAGMVKNCNKFHLVKTTTTCASIMDYYKISWDNLFKWNPAIGNNCGSLWANTYACVGVN